MKWNPFKKNRKPYTWDDLSEESKYLATLIIESMPTPMPPAPQSDKSAFSSDETQAALRQAASQIFTPSDGTQDEAA